MRKLRRATKTKKPRPPCSYKDCLFKSAQTQECLTCEQLIEVGRCPACKRSLQAGQCAKCGEAKAFTVHYCALHALPVQRDMRRHVYTKHPFNIARATLAALKGEEI